MTPLVILAAGLTGEPLADRANENLARYYAQFTPLMGPVPVRTFFVRTPADVAAEKERNDATLARFDDLIKRLEKSRDELKGIDPKAAAGYDEQIEKFKQTRGRLKALLDR